MLGDRKIDRTVRRVWESVRLPIAVTWALVTVSLFAPGLGPAFVGFQLNLVTLLFIWQQLQGQLGVPMAEAVDDMKPGTSTSQVSMSKAMSSKKLLQEYNFMTRANIDQRMAELDSMPRITRPLLHERDMCLAWCMKGSKAVAAVQM